MFVFLFLVFVNYPSALRIGWRVCGSMRTLPIGTLEMSVTAQTSPEADADSGGARWTLLLLLDEEDVVVAVAVAIDCCGVACCC